MLNSNWSLIDWSMLFNCILFTFFTCCFFTIFLRRYLTIGDQSINKEEFLKAYRNVIIQTANQQKNRYREYLELYTRYKLKVIKAAYDLNWIHAKSAGELQNFRSQIVCQLYEYETSVKGWWMMAFPQSEDIHLAHIVYSFPKPLSCRYNDRLQQGDGCHTML